MCKIPIERDLQSDNRENKNLNVGIVNLSCNLDDNTLEVVEKVLQQTPGKDDKTNTACPDPDADAAFSAFKTIPTVASSSTGTTSSPTSLQNPLQTSINLRT